MDNIVADVVSKITELETLKNTSNTSTTHLSIYVTNEKYNPPGKKRCDFVLNSGSTKVN